MNYTTYTVTFGNDAYLALRAAILTGALAERKKTLRALIENNRGYATADTYERELRDLETAATCLIDAKREDR